MKLKFEVIVDMPRKMKKGKPYGFDASCLHTALIGMLIKVVDIKEVSLKEVKG